MLRSFLLLLVAAATVHGQYVCDSATGFPIISESNGDLVENTNLFPPHLDTAGSGFKSTAGRFRVGVVVSKFYTATLTIDNNDPTVNSGTDYTEGGGSTTVSFYPLGAATQPVALGTGVTLDDFATIAPIQTQAQALAAVTTHPEGTLNVLCHQYKSVSIDWSLLVATVDYTASGVTGLDGVNRDGGTYPGAVRFRGAVQVMSTTTLRGTIFQIGAGAAYSKTADDLLFYQVNFPTEVTVSFANLLVYAEVTVQVVVTSHIINLVSLNVANANPTVTAKITFATTVQMPFKILVAQGDLGSTIISGAGTAPNTFITIDKTVNTSGVEAVSSANCLDDGTDTCTQTWALQTTNIDVVQMLTDQGHCRMDVDFQFDFDVQCHTNAPGAGNCPLQNNLQEQFTLTLQSASLCPTVVVDVAWDNPTLTAYEDAAWAQTRTAFRVDDDAFFRAIIGTTTPSAIMTDCAFQTITSVADNTILLYDVGQAGTFPGSVAGGVFKCDDNGMLNGLSSAGCFLEGEFTAGGGAINGSNQCQAAFGLKLVPAVFDVPRFQSETHAITAVLKVDFQGFAKLKSIRMQQSGSSADAPAVAHLDIQSLEVETENTETADGGSSTAGESQTIILEDQGSDMFIYIIIGVCAFVALLIGALVIYLRRSKKEKKVHNAITPQIQVQMQPQHGYITQHTVGMAATA